MAVTTEVVYETGVELVQSACSKLLVFAFVKLRFYCSNSLFLPESARQSIRDPRTTLEREMQTSEHRARNAGLSLPMCLMQRGLLWSWWSSCSSRPVTISLCLTTMDFLLMLQAHWVFHNISTNFYPIVAQDSLIPVTVASRCACERRKHSYPGAGSWGCGGGGCGSALGPLVGRWGCGSSGCCCTCCPRNSAGGHSRSRNDASELHFDFW